MDLSKYGKAVQDGAEWCKSQGGSVVEYQYSYISREAKVVGFGKKRLMCTFGVYTLIDVETLASPYLTLAQSFYIHPLENWKWDKKRLAYPCLYLLCAYLPCPITDSPALLCSTALITAAPQQQPFTLRRKTLAREQAGASFPLKLRLV